MVQRRIGRWSYGQMSPTLNSLAETPLPVFGGKECCITSQEHQIHCEAWATNEWRYFGQKPPSIIQWEYWGWNMSGFSSITQRLKVCVRLHSVSWHLMNVTDPLIFVTWRTGDWQILFYSTRLYHQIITAHVCLETMQMTFTLLKHHQKLTVRLHLSCWKAEWDNVWMRKPELFGWISEYFKRLSVSVCFTGKFGKLLSHRIKDALLVWRPLTPRWTSAQRHHTN